MKEKIVKKISLIRIKSCGNKVGSALMMVMFILSAVMIIIFGGSSVVISGLKMGRVQSDSIHAYYAAESGAEKLLFQFRKEDLLSVIGEEPTTEPILTYVETSSPSFLPWSYEVYYNSYSPLVFTSLGSYGQTRRSVEITFY